jgi:hypothetical protein
LPTVLEVAGALADALSLISPADELTVADHMLFTPDAPALDVYPADPSEEDEGFGAGTRLHWFTVRLRVATSDAEGVQDFLYNSRNPTGPESVRAALLDSGSDLDDVADAVTILGPSGFQLYEDATTGAPRYLGQEWRVGIHVSEEPAS